MRIIDCDARYGADGAPIPMKPCPTARALLSEMDNAGIDDALVFRAETETVGAELGDKLLFADMAQEKRLHAVATVLPTCTGEFPEPRNLEGWLKQNRVKALRLAPGSQRYSLTNAAIGDTLSEASRLRVPVRIETAYGATMDDIDRIARDFPDLRIQVLYNNCWPSARYLYPLVKGRENVRIVISYMFTADGVEDFVGRFGPKCLMYGSGFPICYLGASILMVRHSRVPEAAREAILGLNALEWMEDAP